MQALAKSLELEKFHRDIEREARHFPDGAAFEARFGARLPFTDVQAAFEHAEESAFFNICRLRLGFAPTLWRGWKPFFRVVFR